jgi:hypothetical protein
MEENLMDEDQNIDKKTLLERLVLNCVQIPGKLYPNPEMKVIVYDYDNENIKINEERLFIGVAYMIMGRIELHSWFNIKDYSKIIYPGVPLDTVNLYEIYRYSNSLKVEGTENSMSKLYLSHKERLNVDFKETRSKLKSVFSEIFGGDELLSEYLLMYLSSRVFSRYSTIVTGKLCLNISKLKLEKDLQTLEINPSNKFNISSIDACLKKLFGSICNQSLFFSSTVKNLNDIPFKSFFDVNKDELRQGYLQVVDSTYLLLDERVIEAGQLNENGLNNLQALANLIEGQFMHYEYPYNKVKAILIKVEINQDVKIMVLSETKPLISKNAPSITEVPLVRSHPFNFGFLDTLKEQEFEKFKQYMFLIQHPFLKFVIENEISEKIQKDFLSERSKNPEYSPDNLDKNLNLSKLYAISNGATNLLFEDYFKVKELESYRSKRLLDGENKNNK